MRADYEIGILEKLIKLFWNYIGKYLKYRVTHFNFFYFFFSNLKLFSNQKVLSTSYLMPNHVYTYTQNCKYILLHQPV